MGKIDYIPSGGGNSGGSGMLKYAPQGIQGPQGAQGIQGPKGDQGNAGADGSPIPFNLPCLEDITAGMFVSIYVNNGTAYIRKTDATLGYLAHGYVLQTFLAGSNATFYCAGINVQSNSCSPGPVFLSTTTPGRVTNEKPVERSGHWLQKVGDCIGTTSVIFNKDIAIQLT